MGRSVPAEIIETPDRSNGYCWRVKTDDGAQHLLRGVGAPIAASVGDRGTVEYRSGPSYGLYFWEPEPSGGSGG